MDSLERFKCPQCGAVGKGLTVDRTETTQYPVTGVDSDTVQVRDDRGDVIDEGESVLSCNACGEVLARSGNERRLVEFIRQHMEGR